MTITKELITAEEQIKTILEDRISAIYMKDVSGVLNKYAPDGVSFGIFSPLKNLGIEIIRSLFQSWFDTYKAPIHQEMNSLVVNAGEDVAFSYCLTRTIGTSTKGEEFDMWYRVTTGFHKSGNKWLITHEHLSEPIDTATGKGMFELKP
jgi:ketosteroid isomerase-like protein